MTKPCSTVQLLGLLGVMYTLEPLLGRVYVTRALQAAESVLTQVRLEVFRVLLMQPISFYDRHSTTEITNSLAVDLEAVRSAVFGYCTLLMHRRLKPQQMQVCPPVHRAPHGACLLPDSAMHPQGPTATCHESPYKLLSGPAQSPELSSSLVLSGLGVLSLHTFHPALPASRPWQPG